MATNLTMLLLHLGFALGVLVEQIRLFYPPVYTYCLCGMIVCFLFSRKWNALGARRSLLVWVFAFIGLGALAISFLRGDFSEFGHNAIARGTVMRDIVLPVCVSVAVSAVSMAFSNVEEDAPQ